MKVTVDLLIRTEASPQVGHGHVMRCLALAQEGKRRGLVVGFGSQDDYTSKTLRFQGEEFVCASSGKIESKCIIRDFRAGSPWREVAREVASGATVLLMDDHGPARREASIVSDVLMTPAQSRLLDEGPATTYLYGLTYAPLARQFVDSHAQASPGSTALPKLLICFGGRDTFGVTPMFVKSLDRAGWHGPTVIIADPKHKKGLLPIVSKWHRTEVLENVKDVARLMKMCDLVATKLGLVMLEAFCVGLGCVLIEPTQAHFDLSIEHSQLQEYWPAIEYGMSNELDFDLAAVRTIGLLNNKITLRNLGRHGAELVDGRGAERIINALLVRAGA